MSRKLQAEIERVFKKVAEGIEDFEECYDKVLNASNPSQKEKYETDLKKEIKKLQRLRDQIKTWLQSNDIKDKQDLLHHRKLIEKQMEKFKAIEKEMKTKAYSKEGLSQSTRLDPKEKEKLDLCNWLVDSVDTLSTQVDVLEANAETIESTMGKKRRDQGKLERVNRILERVERHKYHIRCLERIQRLLENESLSTEQVQSIREDVNYYVEENEDDDFIEDEYIYDELSLDDDDGLFTIPGDEDTFHHDAANDSSSDRAGYKEPKHTPPAVDIDAPPANRAPVSSNKSSAPKLASTSVPQPTALPPAPVESKNAWADVKESVLSPSKPSTSTQSIAPPPPASALAQPWAAIASQNVPSTTPTTTSASGSSSINQLSGLQASRSENASAESQSRKRNDGSSDSTTPEVKDEGTLEDTSQWTRVSNPGSGTELTGDNVDNQAKTDGGQVRSSSQRPMGESSLLGSTSPNTSPVGSKLPEMLSSSRQPSIHRPKSFTLFKNDEVPDAFTGLMTTFMKAKSQFAASQYDLIFQRQMVDQSLHGIPSLLDQERPKPCLRTHEVNTPSYYPQTPLPVIEHPGMASRLELDTLFFAFYYQPNTYQQYLAAKELKRQSWRFHKKYLTWFQRFEEPSDITDDYEQGTYIYFDYEDAWCRRKKSEFCFEYRYLEDAELV